MIYLLQSEKEAFEIKPRLHQDGVNSQRHLQWMSMDSTIKNLHRVLLTASRYSRNGRISLELKEIASTLSKRKRATKRTETSGKMTIVLNCQNECSFTNLDTILDGISKSIHKSNPIIIATSKVEIFRYMLQSKLKHLPHLNLVKVGQSDSFKMIYKTICNHISTDTLFISRSLTKFPSETSLRKIESMMSSSAGIRQNLIIGTVSTEDQNLWDAGCYRTKMLLYQYRITKGHDENLDNINNLDCDYLHGAFAIHKTTFQQYLRTNYFGMAFSNDPMFRAPDSFFTKNIFYLDLFNHLKSKSCTVKLILDVTFPQMGNSLQKLTREETRPFLVKNQLNTFISDELHYNFQCDQVNINGAGYLQMQNVGMFIPKCAIDELDALLLFISKILDQQKYEYELDSGSVVGQTKLSATLPWERDHDLMIKPKYFKHFAAFNNTFLSNGYVQKARFTELDKCIANNSFECGYMGIRSKTWRIELVGQSILGSNMYNNKRRWSLLPTIGQMGEQWVKVPANPGSYCRSHYGLDVLKHQQHWADVGGINAWMEYDKVGHWIDCKRPGHHSCCNNFLADGNLIFRDVWL